MRWVWAGLIVAAFIGIFILSYVANHRTPKPEGCENLAPDCEHCAIGEDCFVRAKKQNKEEKK